eukprot:COSAG02_NODE_6069_length_3826_cov_23.093373_4_plen_79_part_01
MQSTEYSCILSGHFPGLHLTYDHIRVPARRRARARVRARARASVVRARAPRVVKEPLVRRVGVADYVYDRYVDSAATEV